MQRQSRIDCRGPVVSRVSPTGQRDAPAGSVSLTIFSKSYSVLYLGLALANPLRTVKENAGHVLARPTPQNALTERRKWVKNLHSRV